MNPACPLQEFGRDGSAYLRIQSGICFELVNRFDYVMKLMFQFILRWTDI